MVVTGGMNEWSLAVLIPAWRSSGLGRTQGEVRTGLQKDVIIAITSGSEPGSYSCPVSALHLLFTMACVLSLKSHEQRKKLFFFLFCFLHFAWLDEMLDWFLLNAEWGQCLSCADMGIMCSLSALTLSPQTMFAHWNLRYQLSASGSVSPSSPSVICRATIPKPLHLPGVIGQTEGRNVSFCFPCHHVLLQRSYFLCSRCAEGVWVLRDADSPVGFVQTHLSSSRLLLGLSNSYQNQ